MAGERLYWYVKSLLNAIPVFQVGWIQERAQIRPFFSCEHVEPVEFLSIFTVWTELYLSLVSI